MEIKAVLESAGLSTETSDFISKGYEGDDQEDFAAFCGSFFFRDVLLKTLMVSKGDYPQWTKGKISFSDFDIRILKIIITATMYTALEQSA